MKPAKSPKKTSSRHFLFGKHAVLAALANPMRKHKVLLITKKLQQDIGHRLPDTVSVQVVEPQKLDMILPDGAVHQGIALECASLKQPSLSDWLSEGIEKPVLLLDQVTDPHNVGAIMRSAAAFDAGCVIIPDRRSPAESAVLAKAASGALEVLPLITVTNLVQAIDVLKKSGYWIYGLDGHSDQYIADVKLDTKTALILGAEGAGLRRLTAEHCDFMVKLPIHGQMESLNVSNAAAVALYDIYRRLQGTK